MVMFTVNTFKSSEKCQSLLTTAWIFDSMIVYGQSIRHSVSSSLRLLNESKQNRNVKFVSLVENPKSKFFIEVETVV